MAGHAGSRPADPQVSISLSNRENGQFVDIKSDNDGSKPSNLSDAYSRQEGRRDDDARADLRGPSARLSPHRVTLRCRHRWPELLERVF
jgi:hypothetical protein